MNISFQRQPQTTIMHRTQWPTTYLSLRCSGAGLPSSSSTEGPLGWQSPSFWDSWLWVGWWMPCRAGWWWLLGEATTWPIHRTRNFLSPGGSEQRLWISPFSVLVNWKQRGGKGLFRTWDYVLYSLSPCHPKYAKNRFRIQEQQLDDFQVMSMVPSCHKSRYD